MGRPAKQSSEETRNRLMRAAEEEFADAGFDGARTVSIARRAKLTHAMLHYYFDTKEALYQAVLETLFAEHAALLVEAWDAGESDDAVSVFQDLLRQAHTLLLEHPDFVRIMLWELAAGAPKLESIAGSYFDRLAKAARRGGAFVRAPHDPRDAAVTILGAVVIYFFEDPLVLRLFGRRRFGPAARRRRGEHLDALARYFFPAGRASR
jgi:AcrR family transcriptional regulator